LEYLLSIYPNPSDEQFTIEHPTIDLESTVNDMRGKQIIKLQATQNITNLQCVDNGIYIFNMKTKGGVSALKLISNSLFHL